MLSSESLSLQRLPFLQASLRALKGFCPGFPRVNDELQGCEVKCLKAGVLYIEPYDEELRYLKAFLGDTRWPAGCPGGTALGPKC